MNRREALSSVALTIAGSGLLPDWKMKRKVIAALAASLILTACGYGGRHPVSTSGVAAKNEITIRIHNYAETSLSVVRHAERVAEVILAEADVRTLWVDCPLDEGVLHDPLCDRPYSSPDFVVNLLPRSMSDRFRLMPGSLGLAAEPDGNDLGFVAFVFYDAVRNSVQPGQDLDQLLGSAIAHELGHLLLGRNSHSSDGLMSRSWSRKQLVIVQQRGLTFSSADAERLQKAAVGRRSAASAQASTSTPPHDLLNKPSSENQQSFGLARDWPAGMVRHCPETNF